MCGRWRLACACVDAEGRMNVQWRGGTGSWPAGEALPGTGFRHGRLMLPAKWRRFCRHVSWIATVSVAAGCVHEQPKLHYVGKGDHRYYRDYATEIEYPVVAGEISPELGESNPVSILIVVDLPAPLGPRKP